MKRPSSNKESGKMTATTSRMNACKAKKPARTSKITTPKTASSGIKHQVILPRNTTVITSPSSTVPSVVKTSSLRNIHGNVCETDRSCSVTKASTSTSKTGPRSGRVSKRNGVWYLGGNHVVKLLTSVDGDLDHSVLSKLAAVPTVVGELALSVESLVSDDVTVGGFENDLLAKITSNTLTAKRGIMTAAAASTTTATTASLPQSLQPVSTRVVENTNTVQPAPHAATSMADDTNTSQAGQVGEGQVPNPLLANYQPVPNPLAIRVTPPASPHANASEQQQPATVPNTRAEMPMIQAR